MSAGVNISHHGCCSLNKAFYEGNGQSMRSTPALLRTPPYVTSRPVVTHRELSFLPSPGAADDALSVGVMLECIRVLINTPDWEPRHSIVFCAYHPLWHCPKTD